MCHNLLYIFVMGHGYSSRVFLPLLKNAALNISCVSFFFLLDYFFKLASPGIKSVDI